MPSASAPHTLRQLFLQMWFYVAPPSGGEPSQVRIHRTGPKMPAWSPDDAVNDRQLADAVKRGDLTLQAFDPREGWLNVITLTPAGVEELCKDKGVTYRVGL